MPLALTFPEGCAFVAGGTGNVGPGVVRRMAESGMPTIFTYRNNADRAQALCKALREEGFDVWSRQMDMCNSRSIDDALSFAEATAGPLRAVLCPAGATVPFNRLADFTPAEIDAFISGDALAFFRLVHGAVPRLRHNGGGRIVLCSTMALRRVIDFDGISPFSKGAVEALIRQVAAEEAENGITCNGVAIGVVFPGGDDEQAAFMPPAPPARPVSGDEMFSHVIHNIRKIPRLGRWAEPAEAGDLFAFLVSDQARYVTGQVVALDGGATM